MIRRLATVSAWLLVGAATWLAIFWGLLHVPESSVWMLALSAVLALALVVVAGAVLAGASAEWDLARPPAHGLRAGVRTVPAALAAALLFGAIWWLTGLVFEWHTGIAGQIDAWVIARTGRPNARWIHFTIFWATLWLRWSIGLAVASSLLGALTTAGAAALRDGAWLRSGLVPARWLTITFWFVLLVAIPWHLVDSRPARLSLGVEPLFVGAKLTAIAVAMAVGCALVLRVGHRATKNI